MPRSIGKNEMPAEFSAGVFTGGIRFEILY
jgi:hypothetical protein